MTENSPRKRLMENSITLHTYKYRIGGVVPAIASKSHAHRLIIAASLASEETRIRINTSSKDIEATIDCMTKLGARFEKVEDGFVVSPIRRDDKVSKTYSVDCGESGSTLRFLLPILGVLGFDTAITMHGRLSERPLSPLYEEMERHGVTMSEMGSNPFSINRKMSGGIYEIAGNISSQYITGLLLALPMAKEDSEIRVTGKLESRPYVDITLSVLDMFGIDYEEMVPDNPASINESTRSEISTVFSIKGNQQYNSPKECTVSGDWSNAAFFLSAGAMSKDGVTVTGLDMNSPQGDKRIVDLLREFGADITIMSHDDINSGSTKSDAPLSSVTVKGGHLHGIDIDAADIPDLVPILSAVAATAEGTTTIRNIERLRIKESDRVKTIIETLTGLGAEIYESSSADSQEMNSDGSCLVITGKPSLSGGTINSFNDHRIAMTAAVLSIACSGPVTINDPFAVNKSYPSFYEDFDCIKE